MRWIYVIKVTLIAVGALSSLFVCFIMKKGSNANEVLSYSNYFIFHLSLSDLFFRFVGILDIALEHVNKSPLICKTIVFFQFACACCCFVLLAGISVDRHKSICHPFARFKSKPRRFIVIIAVWLYAFILSSGFIYSATNGRFRRRLIPKRYHSGRNNTTNFGQRNRIIISSRQNCVAVPPNEKSELVFTIYFLFSFVVPLITMAVMYTKVILFLRQRSRSKLFNSRVAKCNFKAIFMLIVVFLSFLISWGPIMLVDILLAYNAYGRVGAKVFGIPLLPLAETNTYTSSVFNSIIYAFGNSNFRNKAKQLLKKLNCSARNRISNY